MKKLSFIIVALMALAGALQSSAQMRWGATAGIDITNMKWSQKSFRNEPFKSTKSLGYTAGIIGEYEIPGIGFGIDLGLQYAQRGASFNMGDFEIWNSDGYGNERSYLHYLDIPIHLRFKYSNLNGFERKLCPFVFVGPELSILLAHNKLEKNGEAAFDYKPVQLGLAVGVGVLEVRKVGDAGVQAVARAAAVAVAAVKDPVSSPPPVPLRVPALVDRLAVEA